MKCRSQHSFTQVYANQILDVKVFSGDCINDTPEFREVQKNPRNSRRCMHSSRFQYTYDKDKHTHIKKGRDVTMHAF